ncbi:MAG: DNA polymerase III subunit alpha [Candidatus Caccosoma sp.]|nr:DNA polymerase III subunit alpha [Candidatus Caccosoma sp.]
MSFIYKMKSDYSFLSSAITIDYAISFCKAYKEDSCALIDDNLHGSLQFYYSCISASIKPIIGLEAKVKYKDEIFPLIFIAKNANGFKNISYISTLCYNSFIDYKNLALYASDVIIIISSEDSYVSYLLKNNNIFTANEFMDSLKSAFKEIYFGIYRYRNKDKKEINDFKEYASVLNIKCIAFQYATHKSEKDCIVLNLLDSIKNNKPANKDFLNIPAIVEAYLKTYEQIKIYYDNDELNNLNELIKSINLIIKPVEFSLPSLFDNPNQTLYEKAKERLIALNLINDEKYIQRFEYEYSVISKMGFSNYYLIVADYVNYAKSHDIAVGPSRGSGGASLIAYLLNITTIDPLKYDLLFERFLNVERINYPDFDVDFIDTKRDEVIEYVKEKYGVLNVARIATYQTYGVKGAIRDLGRVMKFNNEDIDYVCKNISNDCISLNDEYKNNEKFKNMIEIHPQYKALCSLASKIEGLKKQVGLHAAGIIISKEQLPNYIPCFYNDTNSLAIQFDYAYAEKIGLVKMDFLGLKNLAIIDYAIKKINKRFNKNYTIDNFKYDDKTSYDLISKNETIGIFQLESAGINKVISQLKPNSFNEVVDLLALYRPGPMDNINEYISRKNNKPYQLIDDSLSDILKPTYGIIIYQEQIMQICQRVCLFSFSEADILRRAISKKKIKEINNLKEKFINGAINNGFSKQKAILLYNYIEKFAQYGFNKAHSVGYAKISVMMAYIKANYKTIFYESLINVNGENNERLRLILNEAKKNNIKILPPSVNESDKLFTSTNDTLRFGLENIKTIKSNISQVIIDERNKEKFNDLHDFIIRMVLNDISLQILADLTYANALSCFLISKEKIIANLTNLYNYASLFKGLDYKPNSYNDAKYNNIDIPLLIFENNEIDYLKKEYDLLGVYLSTHPITKIKNSTTLKYNDITSITNGLYNLIAKIIQLDKKKTRKGTDYITLTIEDDSASLRIYEYKNMLNEFKKGDIVYLSINKNGEKIYINDIKKLEV